MTTGAWFHCFAGISGDMAFGSLIDAGADLEEVRLLLRGLGVDGWSIEAQDTQRCGVTCTHLLIETAENAENKEPTVVRTFATIKAIIEQAQLPKRVKDRALVVFGKLAVAEGRLHGSPPQQVHFHEVGGVDAIVDIVGTCAALEVLGVDHVYASAVATGTGTIHAAHGLFPNPAPAVVELLADAGAPVYGRDLPVELTTPTGAAIVAGLAERFGAMPQFARLDTSGFGAGSSHLEGMPNCTQVVIGQLDDREFVVGDLHGQPVMLLEVNVDDATGETIAHAISALLDAGAHDAWVTPILMKKGRPAYTVSALADVALADAVATVLVAETGSFGMRGQVLDRWPLKRSMEHVHVDGETVGLKVSGYRTKAEYDDVARIARRRRRPVREVTAQAEAQTHWHTHDSEHSHPHPHDHSHGLGNPEPNPNP